jgi:hypothetical protein
VDTGQAPDVLNGDQRWPQDGYGAGDVGPYPGAGADAEPGLLAGEADVGAREPGRQDVHRFDLGEVDGGDVAVVRDAREAVGEDLCGPLVPVGPAVPVGRLVLGVPGDLAAEDSLDGHVETAVAGAQGANAESHDTS